MEYFKFKHSLNLIEVGTYPQITEAIYSSSINHPRFIDQVFNEKASFIPITATGIMDKRAVVTDLVSAAGMGYTLKLLISGRLRDIFLDYRSDGLEFFNSPIIVNSDKKSDYWVTNFYEDDSKYVDYEKSTILSRIRRPEGGTRLEKIHVGSFEEFQSIIRNNASNSNLYFIRDLKLINSCTRSILNIRYLEDFSLVVRDDVKERMVNLGITGVCFEAL